MRTEMKILGVAAIMTSVSGAAIAQSSTTTTVPQSLETSRIAESDNLNSVETFTEEETIAESADTTRAAEAGIETTTEVDSTIDDGSIPESFETTDLAQAADLEGANGSVNFMGMNDTVVSWNDDEAAEMRSAIVANTMVKDALEAEGYTESDVVAAYKNGNGGLTLVVDG